MKKILKNAFLRLIFIIHVVHQHKNATITIKKTLFPSEWAFNPLKLTLSRGFNDLPSSSTAWILIILLFVLLFFLFASGGHLSERSAADSHPPGGALVSGQRGHPASSHHIF